jgi:acyl carrier protein
MRGAPGALFPAAQLAVFATDWSHLVGPEAPRVPPLFAELVADVVRSAPQGAAASAGAAAGHSVLDRLQATPPNRRRRVLRNFVRQQAAKVLGLQGGEALDVNEPLRQLGLDSLMALELRNALGKALNRTLPATVTFDNPSVEALADFLWVEVFADQPDRVGRDVPTRQSETFESMTEDELAVRLAVRLESLGNR